MSSVPGFDVDLRPQLPQVFPDEEITVDAEEKVFIVSETSDGPEPKLSYVLDKAPVSRVENVQGTDSSGANRTFTQGIDYTLEDALLSFDETFIYTQREDEYALNRVADDSSVSIVDQRGNTYVEGVDFEVDDTLTPVTDTIVWQDEESNPLVDDSFTVSYESTFENSEIRWIESGDNLPAAESTFFVTYVAESVLSRYLDGYEEEFDTLQDAIDVAVSNKFVRTADGDSLDELGQLFGDVIGKRRGRNDREYRQYLQTVVQSFTSRGTKSGIKLAVSAATDVPLANIELRENFEQNKYEVVVSPEIPVNVSLIESVADIADPSGIEQLLTRFPIEDGDTLSADAVSEGPKLSELDTALTADSVGLPNEINADSFSWEEAATPVEAAWNFSTWAAQVRGFVFRSADSLLAADTVSIDPLRSVEDTLIIDEVLLDSLASIDVMESIDLVEEGSNTTSSGDSMFSGDSSILGESISPPQQQAKSDEEIQRRTNEAQDQLWEDDDDISETDWGFFQWTESIPLIDKIRAPSVQQLRVSDLVSIDAATSSDAVLSIDEASINAISSLDIIKSVDIASVDLNTTFSDDRLLFDDDATKDANLSTSQDSITSDAKVKIEPTGANDHRWDDDDSVRETRWDLFEWAESKELIDEVLSPSIQQLVASDSASIDSTKSSDEVSSSDGVFTDTISPIDILESLDGTSVDPRTTVSGDKLLSDDIITQNTNLAELQDSIKSDVQVETDATGANDHRWDDSDGVTETRWDLFQWARSEDLVDRFLTLPTESLIFGDAVGFGSFNFIESVSLDDATSLGQKALSDDSVSFDDERSVDANKTSSNEALFLSDTEELDSNLSALQDSVRFGSNADTDTTGKDNHVWDTSGGEVKTEWDFFEWAAAA